jgi:hypothetical protein
MASGGTRGARPRRVSLPGVAELLRSAGQSPVDTHRQASGRERHAQKITVYLSARELADLERARIALRGYGVSADRGRVVRESLAVLLADLDANGERSLLARRLGEQDRTDGELGGHWPIGYRQVPGSPPGGGGGANDPD